MTVSNKLNSLQICRGIAACLVVLYHFSESSKYFLGHRPLESFFMFGHAGVSFFFVLSGFIIYYIHQKDIGNVKAIPTYLIKRLIRIYPFYWPVLIAVTVGYLMFGTHPGGFDVASINFDYFVRSLLLISYAKHPIVVIAWTLVHEIFFYFIFSFLLLSKRIGALIFLIWGFFIVFSNFFHVNYVSSFIAFLASYYNLEFLMGCLSAWIFYKYPNKIKIPFFIFMMGVFLFLMNGINEVYHNQLLFFHLGRMSDAFKDLTFGFASFLIILGVVKLEQTRSLHFPTLFLLIGNASYSIYLIHNYVLGILFRGFSKIVLKFPSSLHMLVIDAMLMLGFLVSVLVGVLYYHFYEKSVLKYLRRKLLFSKSKSNKIPVLSSS